MKSFILKKDVILKILHGTGKKPALSLLIFVMTTLLLSVTVTPATDEYTLKRLKMIETDISGRGVRDQKVLDAMSRIERHLFVDSSFMNSAYDDHPLPIDEGQTISQPYVVALMTEH